MKSSCRNRHLPGRKNCRQLAGGLLAVRCYELLQHYQRLYHRVCVMSGKNIGFLTAAAAPLQPLGLGVGQDGGGCSRRKSTAVNQRFCPCRMRVFLR